MLVLLAAGCVPFCGKFVGQKESQLKAATGFVSVEFVVEVTWACFRSVAIKSSRPDLLSLNGSKPSSSSFACICKSLRPRSILPGHGYEVVADAVDVIEVVVVVTVVVVTSLRVKDGREDVVDVDVVGIDEGIFEGNVGDTFMT